jgi:hypothetical protein
MIVALCVIFCGLCWGIFFYFSNRYHGERNTLTAQLKDSQDRFTEVATQKAEPQGKLSAIGSQLLQSPPLKLANLSEI